MTLNLRERGITKMSFGEGYVTITYTDRPSERVELPPGGLKVLNCSANQLTELEGLPGELEKLNCSFNRLTKLKKLPLGLEELNCGHNKLTKLKGLPRGLKELDCSNNHLTKLELPEGLRSLVCSGNRLTKLECLPVGLKILQCHRNPLEYIEPLPSRPFGYSYPANRRRLQYYLDYTIYYDMYVIYSSRVKGLLVDLRLEEDCVGPILEDLEFHLNAIWVAL